jgi:hypothetical protein
MHRRYHRIAKSASLTALLALLAGCAIPLTPREPLAGDQWCDFKVTAVKGKGALKVGDNFCYRCGAARALCPATQTFSLAGGTIEYTGTCVSPQQLCGSCTPSKRGAYYQ